MDAEELTIQSSPSSMGDIRTWQKQLLRGILRALVVIGAIALVPGSYSAYKTQDVWLIPFYLAVYGILLAITFWRRVSYTIQAWVLVGVIYGMGILELTDTGLGGDGRVYLLTFPLLAGLFLGRRQSIGAMILAAATMAVFGWGYSTGNLVPTVDLQEINTGPTWWLNSIMSMVMLGATLLISQSYLIPRLADALAQSRRLTQELAAHRVTLEEQVTERTADLARRSTHLEAAAQVAREATAIQDVGRLLEETTHLISDRFDFYHAGIFLLDEAGEYAVLRAASSVGGQRMLARGHRLRVGEEGIVGYVTGRGEPRIALDVGEDAVFFDNPDLPDTRSEMALPLRARGEIIGALDVQSMQPAAFSDEDVAVLQTLADQLALAISNTRLFQRVRESLEAERRAYSALAREAWQELLRAQPALGGRYDPQGILPTNGRWSDAMKQAAQAGELVASTENTSAALAIPIKVRGQVIGVLDAQKPAGADKWTTEEITLLETLTAQLGVALESARLHQDTQRRATRERLTREITDKMRRASGVEGIVQTAVDELFEALGASRTFVRLGAPPAEVQDGNAGHKE